MSRPFPSRFARATLALAATAALGGCASSWPWSTAASGEAPPLPRVAHVPSEPRAVVRMRADRSLEVTTLVSERGGRGGVRIVRPGHRDYDALLAATGIAGPGHYAYPVRVR